MPSYQNSVKKIIRDLYNKKITQKEAFAKLRDLPYLDLGFAKIDTHRGVRKGFPEVIYGEGKNLQHLTEIVKSRIDKENTIILTRTTQKIYEQLRDKFPQMKFNPQAKIAYFQKKRLCLKKGWVNVITAGTSDIAVAEEAAVTLEIMGNRVRRLYDVGVAGIHRLLDKRYILNDARAIIVVAGMDGVLPSVVGGLVNKPVIAVPTSIGYGAHFKGIASLLTMLNCCAPGVVVVNIDNGFGAAYFADMIK